MNWTSEILYLPAPFFKAVADTLFHHHSISVFSKLNVNFWDPYISSEKAKRIFGYKLDAWHLSMSMIIFLVTAAIVVRHEPKLPFYYEYPIWGFYWIACFGLFYNRLLLQKKWRRKILG